MDLSSYVSADFLSAGVTSTSTATNSYTLRLRQAWAQAKFDGGWSFLGGQEWSLLTENGKGISPDDDLGRTNDARPKTIDPSYNVGFVFTRQYGIRLTKDFITRLHLPSPWKMRKARSRPTEMEIISCSVRRVQATATTPLPPTRPIPLPILSRRLPLIPASDTTRSSDCSTDSRPRVSLRRNRQPHHRHLRRQHDAWSQRTRSLQCFEEWRRRRRKRPLEHCPPLRLRCERSRGSGIGRYAPAGLSDLSINADGTLHLIRNFEGLTTLEWKSKKFDIFGYGGVEYAQRTASFDPITGKEVGYGAPLFNNSGCYTELAPAVNTGFTPTTLANCTADTRAVIEGTAGFWYRFYSGPRGRFQFGTQYSYVTRETWSGVGPSGAGHPGVTPEGIDNMVFTSFRYILP